MLFHTGGMLYREGFKAQMYIASFTPLSKPFVFHGQYIRVLQCHGVVGAVLVYVGACGQVDKALDSRSVGLRLDSQCWPCVEVSGKLRIPHCLSPPSRNGYLVHRSKVGSIVAGCCAPTARGGKV